MIKNKIMNLLRKGNDTMKLRKMAMVFAVASMALVGGVACGVSDKDTAKTEKVEIAENTENNKEESSVEETTEEVVEETTTKEEVKEATKEEVKKDKEEVKKEQTSNTDKKKEENVKTEKPSTGNSNNTSSVNKPSTGNGTTNKPSTGNSNNNSNTNKPSNGGVNNKPSTKPSTPEKPVHNHTHTHTWEEVTTTVYHEEQGHYENVVVKEAWTEKKPVYETQARDICNSCNADLTGTNIAQHVKEHMINGTDKGGHRTEYKKVQVGTETINHPAVTERKWVIDKPAWTEKVVTGHKCSGCGATK